MKRIGWISGLVALALAMFAPVAPSFAQTAGAVTVSACGTPPNTPVVGNPYPLTMDSTGKLCVGSSTSGAVQLYAGSTSSVSGFTTAMTGTTSTLILAAPGASLRNYVTQLTCGNSHATVGTFVNVQDGNGGSTIYTLPAAAVYGGAAITFPMPLRQPSTNTGLYVVDATTGANVICSASGYSGS